MAIPNSPTWSALTDPSGYPAPEQAAPDVPFAIKIYDLTLGPAQLSDSQGKLNTRYWLAYQQGSNVIIQGAEQDEWATPITLFTEPLSINQLGLTFDQLGRPLVFYGVGESDLKLFWYDPVAEQSDVLLLAQGHDPFAKFDVVNDTSASYSDAMLFYVRDDAIFMRVQRDRFAVEYATPVKQQSATPTVVYTDHSEDITGVSLSATLQAPVQGGDTVIATIMHRDTLTLPTGWVQIGVTQSVEYGQRITQALLKTVEADIGTTHTFTQATSQRINLNIVAVRGGNITATFGGARVNNPQSPSPLPDVGAEHSGSLAIGAASFVYTFSSNMQSVTVSSPYTLASTGTQIANRLGVATSLVPEGGIQGAQFTHEVGEPKDGVAMVTLLKASAEAFTDVDIQSSGMRSDNRFQVVYRVEDKGHVPPDNEDPVAPPLSGRYYYLLSYRPQLKTPNTLISSPSTNTVKIGFSLIGANGSEEKSGGLGHFGFPIYCEGAATVYHPMYLRYNRLEFTEGRGVRLREELLKVARDFSLSFIYDDTKQLYLVLVLNGDVNTFKMPFNLDDARWRVEAEGIDVRVYRNDILLFQDSITRGVDFTSDRFATVGGKFASYNMGPSQFNWRYNFTGALYDLSVDVDDTLVSYPINDVYSAAQTSVPAGQDITIIGHRDLDWRYNPD